MKIGIIGTGEVGGTLGRLWARKKHQICFGSRDPENARVKALVRSAGQGARAATLQDAARFGDIVVLATPWPATRVALRRCGSFNGKILIDCTNPFNERTQEVAVGRPSGAEQVSKWAKTSRVVKAFNTVGANLFGHPKFRGRRLTLYICGDPRAKRTAKRLAEELGFEVADCGLLRKAVLLEALAGLWVTLAPSRQWKIAFRLVR